MINLLHTVDDYLIRLTQEAYLWLWDRTGTYVGTLIFAACVGDHVLSGPLKLFDFLVLAVMGAWAGYRYVTQSKDLRRLNDIQRAWAEVWFRRPFMVLIAAFCVGEIVQMELWRLASNVCFCLWNYLACIQVREREPQEFLSFRKTVGAGI